MDVETIIAELTARIDALEETVEELRYAGPAQGTNLWAEDDYDEVLREEWDV